MHIVTVRTPSVSAFRAPLSSYVAIKAFTVRFDVRMDESQNWINGTPARDFYMDEVTLDANPDQREKSIIQAVKPVENASFHHYSMNRTVFFAVPGASDAQIFDVLGRTVQTRRLNGSSELNSITVPSEGIYILKVKTMDGQIRTAKVLVK